MFYCNFGNVHDIVPLFLRVFMTHKTTFCFVFLSQVQGVECHKMRGALLLLLSQFLKTQTTLLFELIYLLLYVEHL